MASYYNETDPYCVQWLLNLIYAGLIPAGDVDPRPIQEVQPDELLGYTQCHFFAGIGGWPCAARLAGWPDERPLWTGSCPCQPFSVAGDGRGSADPRHLWPDFFRIIRAGRPARLVGEQVAGPAGYAWFDGVGSDLEGEGYACRAVDIPACSVNAPHIRQRLYWLANLGDARLPNAEQRREPGAAQQRLEARPAASEPCHGSSPWDGGERIGPDSRGTFRRLKLDVRVLDDGTPCRVARVRAFGNAIVPSLAAEVLRSWMEVAP